jgi:hypothetical protein
MEKFNWIKLHNKVEEIVSDTDLKKIKKNNITNKKETDFIDLLDGYTEITRNNLDDLEIGMHIKYIKKELDLESGETFERVYNGGFLMEIKKGDKIYEMILVVKSNIIWKLRFIKYKIFGKKSENFVKKTDRIKDDFREMFGDLISNRKKELEDEQNKKIKEIVSNKNKYTIIFENNIDSDID